MPTTGVILAGGRASRFGGAPKGLSEVGGRRMIDRVADALREATDELLLVANAPDAGGWLPGVPVAPDVLRDAGSLGGIHAALSHAHGAALVVAWDLPFVTGALLADLRAAGEANDVDAAACTGTGAARLEPLCTWYGPRCRAVAERLIRAGDLRAGALLDAVRTHVVPAERVRAHGDPALLFLNVNDPRALEAAEAAGRA